MKGTHIILSQNGGHIRIKMLDILQPNLTGKYGSENSCLDGVFIPNIPGQARRVVSSFQNHFTAIV